MTPFSSACQLGQHDLCFKGFQQDRQETHWCKCSCHPWEEHISGWQRLKNWLAR